MKKKVKLEHVRHQSSIKCVTRKFLEVSPFSHPKKRQRNVEKNCCSCKVVFLLVRPIVVFKSHNRTERESKGVLTSYGRFFVEEGQFIKYTPSTSSLRQPFFFFSFIDPASLWRAESSGSQPVYRKLFSHGPHSSKNNCFEIKISQRRDWETPSLSYYGSCRFSPLSLPSKLSITQFYILFEQTIKLILTRASLQ